VRPEKLLQRIRAGNCANVDFKDFVRLNEALGFELRRIRGSHRIYKHPVLGLRLEIQPRGQEAKTYQVRQLLVLIAEYDLRLREA
jgi:predicted RNA binding protein YcfA (HicA-like mRNA interferase family)